MTTDFQYTTAGKRVEHMFKQMFESNALLAEPTQVRYDQQPHPVTTTKKERENPND